MALGQDLLVHYDPQWAGSWLGGVLAGISPTSPTPIMGQKGLAPVGRKNLRWAGEEPAERGHFRDLNSIFYCTVFFWRSVWRQS